MSETSERRDPSQDFGLVLHCGDGSLVSVTFPDGEDGKGIRFDWEAIERVAATEGGNSYLARCLIQARDWELPR